MPANYIAKWDGASWSPLGSGVSGGSIPGVHAVALIGTNLYTGGYISGAGGVPVNNIAKWDGSTWSSLGSGVDSGVQALAVDGGGIYSSEDASPLQAGSRLTTSRRRMWVAPRYS